MSKKYSLKIPFLLVCLGLMSSAVLAQDLPGKKDVFKGKLFAPNIILEKLPGFFPKLLNILVCRRHLVKESTTEVSGAGAQCDSF